MSLTFPGLEDISQKCKELHKVLKDSHIDLERVLKDQKVTSHKPTFQTILEKGQLSATKSIESLARLLYGYAEVIEAENNIQNQKISEMNRNVELISVKLNLMLRKRKERVDQMNADKGKDIKKSIIVSNTKDIESHYIKEKIVNEHFKQPLKELAENKEKSKGIRSNISKIVVITRKTTTEVQPERNITIIKGKELSPSNIPGAQSNRREGNSIKRNDHGSVKKNNDSNTLQVQNVSRNPSVKENNTQTADASRNGLDQKSSQNNSGIRGESSNPKSESEESEINNSATGLNAKGISLDELKPEDIEQNQKTWRSNSSISNSKDL